MKKFSKILIILFSLFCIIPKIDVRKLPRPSVSISVSPTPTPTGIMASNLNIL